MKNNYFENKSDQELLDIVSEYDLKFIPLKSPLREAADAMYGNETMVTMIGIAIPLVQEMAKRFKVYSPHITAPAITHLH